MIEKILGDDVKKRNFLPEIIYGANDGIITTFAVISGVTGAALDTSIVLILGTANLFADGFSMATSDFLSSRTEEGMKEGDGKNPYITATITFLAFVIAGAAPMVPYLFVLEPLFWMSVFTTALTFFAVGAGRSLVTDMSWYRAGTEMLVVGMIAAIVAFTVGKFLKGIGP